MISPQEQEAGLERQVETTAKGEIESAEEREAIFLAFELETALDPENPRDAVEVLRAFAAELRAFLKNLPRE